MNISEEADPQTAQRRGEARYTDRRARYPELVARVEKPVGTRSRHRADAGRDEPFERGATCDESHPFWSSRRLGTEL